MQKPDFLFHLITIIVLNLLKLPFGTFFCLLLSLRIRFRTSGSTNSTANYGYQAFSSLFTSTSLSVLTRTVDGNTFLNTLYTDTSGAALMYDIFNPFAAKNTFLQGIGTRTTDGVYCNGVFSTTTSFDGFQIFPNSGTITGTVSVYGYNK